MSALFAWWRLLRPMNSAMAALAVFVGALVAAGPGALAPSLAPVALAMVTGFLATAAGNVANDLGDIETDRRAHAERPLVTGEVSLRVARATLAALAGLAALTAGLVSPAALALTLVALTLLALYEVRSKARGLEGNALVALLAAAPFLLGALAVGRSPWPLAALAGLLAVFATLGREVLKDIEDAAADTIRATLPRTAGEDAARAVARGSLALAVFLSPLPYLLENVIRWPYLAIVGVADAGFLVAAGLATRPGPAQRWAKASMLVALLAFVAGRL